MCWPSLLFLLEAERYRSELDRVDVMNVTVPASGDKASESRDPVRTDRAERLGRAADVYARYVGGADSTLPLTAGCRRRLLYLGVRQAQHK